jgi:hypothetical protein
VRVDRITKTDVLAAAGLVLVILALTAMIVIGLELLEPCARDGLYSCDAGAADPCCR